MKPIDFAKATGVAVLVLALNLLIATLVILAYSIFIEPGHPQEFYNEAALKIAPWCSHTVGTALFFVAGYWFARGRTRRDALVFAVAFTVLYAIIDSAIVAFATFVQLEFWLSMLAKLVAALAGAFLATRKGTT
jgi:hypothetical protein